MDTTENVTDIEAARAASIEAGLRADGLPTEESMQVDYFGFDETLVYVMPDGKSVIHHQVLNEGARTRYLRETNRDVTLKKGSGDAVLNMSPGDERHALLKAAIVGWNLVRGSERTPVPFNPSTLADFLQKSNPVVIDGIEKAVRLANPWLLAEVTVEQLDKEIADLQELRAKKIEEEAGNAA